MAALARRGTKKPSPVTDLDPESLAELRQHAKLTIRKRMRALRAALPQSACLRRSQAIVGRLTELEAYRSADGVALFWPIEDRREVDLQSLDALARAANKRVYYPFMEPSGEVIRTGFRLVTQPSEMVERGRGFREPPADAPEARRGDIDLVVVPALAAAVTGHRIGYGAGYYDATLPDVRPPALAVIVAFDFQLLAELPSEAGDVACDLVVTDAGVLDVRAET